MKFPEKRRLPNLFTGAGSRLTLHRYFALRLNRVRRFPRSRHNIRLELSEGNRSRPSRHFFCSRFRTAYDAATA